MVSGVQVVCLYVGGQLVQLWRQTAGHFPDSLKQPLGVLNPVCVGIIDEVMPQALHYGLTDNFDCPKKGRFLRQTVQALIECRRLKVEGIPALSPQKLTECDGLI